MVVEVDINVKCPACSSVMVRYHNLDNVVCETKGCANHGIKYELPKLILRRKSAQQSVHLTAFGVGMRARFGNWLASLGERIAQSGGR